MGFSYPHSALSACEFYMTLVCGHIPLAESQEHHIGERWHEEDHWMLGACVCHADDHGTRGERLGSRRS
ncbi:protein of unknown function [Cupriavidus neocaledonicus]|uniref:Uncharacterized protein n=1 Tax=Cupriavidus neocaledonicus TaxID=1040979 RepID=A0A375H124_9BURK|nr:protein of unknown function [Cupriavidus neocaledonicus]